MSKFASSTCVKKKLGPCKFLGHLGGKCTKWGPDGKVSCVDFKNLA